MKYTFLTSLVLALVAVCAYLVTQNNVTFSGSPASNKCEVSSIAVATVGSDVSTQLLATSSNRAWARIQQVVNATNTVYISLDEDALATVTSGIHLGDGPSTSSIEYLDLGMNTALPYTGAVRGIAGTGTTTVHVTECKYAY